MRGYCAPLRAADVDTVILGCTHYPLVAPMLQRMLGRGVTLVTSGAGVARSVERALTARGLLNPRSGEGGYRFQCTGDVDAFEQLGTRFLQMPLGEVVHVDCSRVAAADGGGMTDSVPAVSAATAARPATCVRSRSSPGSCARPPARR